MSICIHLQALTQILHLLGQHLHIHRWCPTSLWTGSGGQSAYANRGGLPRRASQPIPCGNAPFCHVTSCVSATNRHSSRQSCQSTNSRSSWWSTSSCSSYPQCFSALFLPVYTPWRSPSRLVNITSKSVASTTRVLWTVTTRQSYHSTRMATVTMYGVRKPRTNDSVGTDQEKENEAGNTIQTS